MIRIIMPKAGQSMEEGTIRRWLKKEGERVEKGEILLEIDTDKATVEVEASESGILHKIICPDGVTVPVLAPIALMGEPGEDWDRSLGEVMADLRALMGGAASEQIAGLAAGGPSEEKTPLIATPIVPETAQAASLETTRNISAAAHEAERVPASPAARRLAREKGVDLARLHPGSGPGGRILSTDLAKAAMAESAGPAVQRRPLSRMRRAIGRTMQASKQNVPHFYMRLTLDADPRYAIYRDEKLKYPCSINDFVVRACALVIREFPAFRSRLENDELVEVSSVNIGVAVGMEDGLIVPVIVDAERLSLRQLAATSRRIFDAARQGKMESAAVATFTISNLGGHGVEEFSAIINSPETAILAVGAIRESVIVKDGFLRPGRVMTMTLSSDHRIIDGLLAARFLGRLKEILETPSVLLHE
jgi:pyruvate dehydrogenase E2 component (dihydrolipoamide acetyltransferase)